MVATPRFQFRDAVIPGPTGDLFVWEGGEYGPAVLLVHGLAGSVRHWRFQLPYLWPQARAVALDLRGHGRSAPAAADEMSVEALADDVAAVADAYDLSPVVLVGHSLGAAVALEWAARDPARVAGLVLVDPTADSTHLPDGEIDGLLGQVAADPRGEFRFHYHEFLIGATEETRRLVLEDLDDTPDDTLIGGLEATMRYGPLPALDASERPTLCFTSPLNDLPYSLPRLRPALKTMHLPGTSHWLMIDRPDEVNGELGRFVVGVGGPEDGRHDGLS